MTFRFAREIIVAPRMPPRSKFHTGNPFTSEGDIVADCDSIDDRTGQKCGWHAMGPRPEVKKAIDEHKRLYHPESIGVILLNTPKQ